MRREQSSATAEDVTKYLKIMIRLLIEQQISSQKMSTGKAILMLDSMGLMSTEIAQIIGWSTNAITTELSKMKKRAKK
jgi:DNA-directed RNA polymerase specialized sigma24 family protein